MAELVGAFGVPHTPGTPLAPAGGPGGPPDEEWVRCAVKCMHDGAIDDLLNAATRGRLQRVGIVEILKSLPIEPRYSLGSTWHSGGSHY